jgi:hypothetical protein
MPALIDTLVVASDGDRGLRNTLDTVLEWHSSVSHYAVSETEDGPTLHLYWTNKSSDHDRESYKSLPRELKEVPFGPMKSVEEGLLGFVKQWLDRVERSPQGDGDGSYSKGWKVEVTHTDFYEVCRISPHWNYYGK